MNWSILFGTYILVFLMEIPDKTALSILLLATRHRGLAVFLGAGLAFVVQSFVAVTFASLLAYFPEKWTRLAAGLMFLFFSFRLWRESKQHAEEEEDVAMPAHPSFAKAFGVAFMTIFIAEWGDLTQLTTAALQVKYRDAVSVFVGSVLALWSVTIIGVSAGKGLQRFFHPKRLQIGGAAIFFVIGGYFLITAA